MKPRHTTDDRAKDVLVQVNVPDIATKQLRFRHSGARRILTISSNLLAIFGFEKGNAVIERSMGRNKGIVIERVQDDLVDGTARIKRVYGRIYKHRRNNPFEHLLEVSSQKLIDESFGAGCTRVHVTFSPGRIIVTPLATLSERALANAARADPDSVFAALTSGVDLASMREEGFCVSAILEWRPQEARDKQDLTETGALTALANSGPVHALFNEDVTACCLDRIGEIMADTPVMLFHASPQCDDHSTLKSAALKARDTENGTSSADMILDLLNIIERIAPPIILFENVPGMISSPAYEIASLRLKRWGYRQHEHVGDARDHGGLTSRRRAYVVFSQLDEDLVFDAPSRDPQRDIWSMIAQDLDTCRDVSGSRSLQRGKACGRLRSVKPGARSLPTPIKSQSRMAKDSIVIEPEDGKFLFPTETLLKRFLGIEKVDLSTVSATLASEIIGQSIDRPHHAMVLRAIRDHIARWRRVRTPIRA